ncbi:hypothetical protein L7F22_046399 [Adiantum nelumboides]|nr:hypothetical protein [Adiantum nelumboides]
MVNITSSTQWSLPFNTSNIAAAGAISSLHSSTPSSATPTAPTLPCAPQNYSSTATFSVPPSPPSCLSTVSCKPGSVFGLNSCHLSLPSSIAHLDLQYTHSSSRRFIEAIVSETPLHHPPTINKPRSAGSFRLEYESFSNWSCKGKELKDAFHEEKLPSARPLLTAMHAPLGHARDGRFSFEGKCISDELFSTAIDNQSSNQGKISISSAMHGSVGIEASSVQINTGTQIDGQNLMTTLPCSTVVTDVPAHVMARAPSRLFNNGAELEGNLTAMDVDLLPMPGLVSLASPLYDSYLSVSPTDSRMTRISSSDYLSTANSSKTSSKMIPDYLGLPPNALQGVNLKPPSRSEASTEVHDLGCPMMKGTSISSEPEEIEVAVSTSTIASSYPVGEDDNFAESHSLAGLWGAQDDMTCNSDSLFHTSEGLASILIDLPHKGASTSSNSNNNEEHCMASEFMMDDLVSLMTPGSWSEAAYAQAGARNGRPPQHIMNSLQIVDMPTMGRHNAPAYPNFEFQQGSSNSLLSAGQHSCESPELGSSKFALKQPRILPSSTNFSEVSDLVVNARQGMSASSIFPFDTPIGPPCFLNIGKKRPYPSYEHPPCGPTPASPLIFAANHGIPHRFASQSLSMEQPQNQAQEMSYSSATQALSAMLYREQGARAGNPRFNWAASYMNNINGEPVRIPHSKARRRHGTAMDPQSIAARTRREKFSDRIRILQSLVPNGERLDTVSMLGQTLEYVRFLQHQVWQLYHGMDPASDIKSEKWKDFLEFAQPAAPTN